MNHQDKEMLAPLQERIGYRFQNLSLLETAVTHSSYANEVRKGHKSNERLEFLGDSVLSVIVADYIFAKYKDRPEGDLTKLRSSLVCEKALYGYAEKIRLGQALLLGRGEENTGGRFRPSVLSDAFEAVIAAIYLDGGLEPAREFVLQFVCPEIEDGDNEIRDYKTILQEIIQKNPEEHLYYQLVGEEGPDHDKKFVVELRLNSNVIGKGVGKSKKQAEQQAAREALALMGELK